MANKVALVTGSRRGIGRAIALQLARDGFDLVVNDYELDDNAENTAAEIRALGGKVLLIQANVGDAGEVTQLFAQVVAHYGRLDVLVNNAVLVHQENFVDIPEAHWDAMMAVDLKGPFLCAQAAARQIIKQGGGGSIINISSVHRARIWAKATVYGIAKAGIVRLTENMAFELGPYGIRVNAIAPGYIDSRVPSPDEPPIGQPDYASYVVQRTPLRRIGLPDDIANTVSFLVSDKASFITGQCLTVDGGVLLGGTPEEYK